MVTDTSSDAILFDGASSNSDGADGTQLTVSHTVGDQTARLLVVSAQGEAAALASCDVTAGAGPYVCVALWYLAAPATGTHDIVVTWAGIATSRTAGGVSVYNAAQQGPEAVATSSADATTSISTNVTSLSDGAWLLDSVASSVAGSGFLPGETNQVERYDVATSGAAGAGSTRPLNSAGAGDVSWSNASSDMAHTAAVFAEAP